MTVLIISNLNALVMKKSAEEPKLLQEELYVFWNCLEAEEKRATNPCVPVKTLSVASAYEVSAMKSRWNFMWKIETSIIKQF